MERPPRGWQPSKIFSQLGQSLAMHGCCWSIDFKGAGVIFGHSLVVVVISISHANSEEPSTSTEV